MKRKNSRAYSFQHTRERMKQRYGMDINKKEYDDLCKMVKKAIEGGCTNSTEKNGKDPQIVIGSTFMGHRMTIVWSVKDKRIRTVLPPSGY